MLPLKDYYFKIEGTNSSTGGVQPSGTLEVTENNLYAVSSYAYVNVNVPTGVTETEIQTMLEGSY